jgi:hypothetical protein
MMKGKILAPWILILGLASPLLAGAADSDTTLVQPRSEGGVTYISGGVGEDEREALAATANEYDLKIVFADTGSGAYLADVRVSIVNMKGKKILEAVSDGPWFFVNLPTGRYKITAMAGGRSSVQQTTVSGGRLTQLHFYLRAE